MAMNAPLRCALIGAGRIAQTYVQACAGHEQIRLLGVQDVQACNAQALAHSAGCAACTRDEEVLALGLDAVILCTPPDTHRDRALFFLQHGLHVLCEKPLCLDRRSARMMFQAARRQRRVLAMAAKFRYVQDVIRARELLQAGLLGETLLCENVFTAAVDMSQRWNSVPAISGGGVLIDNGTHSVDLLRYLLGPLTQVLAVEGRRSQNLPVEDTVDVHVRTANGIPGHIELSWSLHKEQDAYLTIYGSRGTMMIGWKESRYRLHEKGDWVPFGKGYAKLDAFRSQLSNFARAVRSEEDLRMSGEDALVSVEVIAAAYRSLRSGRWVKVPRSSATLSEVPNRI
jgi:predicted dehydrogenase